MSESLTLFKLYKELCKHINIEPIYSGKDIATYVNPIPNDIQFFIKTKSNEEKDKEFNTISETYYSLLSCIGELTVIEKCKNKPELKLVCSTYPERIVSINTILSIFYIHGYSKTKMFKSILKYLFLSY